MKWSKTGGYRFKMRGDRFKRGLRINFHTDGAALIEQAARGSGSGSYNI